jgi:hypothetical protein
MRDLKVKSTYFGENNRFSEVLYCQFITTRVFNKFMALILHANFNYLYLDIEEYICCIGI